MTVAGVWKVNGKVLTLISESAKENEFDDTAKIWAWYVYWLIYCSLNDAVGESSLRNNMYI